MLPRSPKFIGNHVLLDFISYVVTDDRKSLYEYTCGLGGSSSNESHLEHTIKKTYNLDEMGRSSYRSRHSDTRTRITFTGNFAIYRVEKYSGTNKFRRSR